MGSLFDLPMPLEIEPEKVSPPESPAKTTIKEAVKSAFTSYISNCQGADEVRLEPPGCLSTFGFQATLVESLESLILFDSISVVKLAKVAITKDFCAGLGTVSRRDVWERVVGSFIASFLLSHDSIYLDAARGCADRILAIDGKSHFPFALINLKNKVGMERLWENGTTMADIFAGSPELSALYSITKEASYGEAVESIAKKLSEGFWFYNSTTGDNTSTIKLTDDQGFDDFRDLVELTLKIADIPNVEKLSARRKARSKKENGVDLSSNQLRKMMEEGRHDEVLRELIKYIEKARFGSGFSGFVKSNVGVQRRTNVQPSSLLGNLLSIGGYCLSGNKNFWQNGVYNGHGHLLAIKK
jgi:hypothetical protein